MATTKTNEPSFHMITGGESLAPCRICDCPYYKALPHKVSPKGGWIVLQTECAVWIPPTKPESVWNIFHMLGIPTSKTVQTLDLSNEEDPYKQA